MIETDAVIVTRMLDILEETARITRLHALTASYEVATRMRDNAMAEHLRTMIDVELLDVED